MKLVCVYTPGSLRREARVAIWKHWRRPHETIYHRIDPDDPQAYNRIIAEHWSQRQDFIVVEPDIVIREDVATAAQRCECEYGCFPYPWLTDIGPALGCTWFRASFMERYPRAMQEVLQMNVSWNQLDVALMRHILVRQHSEQPHVHLPPVEHLNEAKQLLPDANPEPLLTIPAW